MERKIQEDITQQFPTLHKPQVHNQLHRNCNTVNYRHRSASKVTSL